MAGEVARSKKMPVSPLLTLQEDVVEGNGVNGFKQGIRIEGKMLKPKGMGQTMELAQRVKDCNEGLKQAQFNSCPNMNFNSHPFPCQMNYNHSLTHIVVPNTTAITI